VPLNHVPGRRTSSNETVDHKRPLTTPLGTRILGCLSSRRRRNGADRNRRWGARHLRPNDPVTDVPRPMWEGNDGEDGATLLSPTVSGSWSDGGGGGGRDGGDAGRYPRRRKPRCRDRRLPRRPRGCSEKPPLDELQRIARSYDLDISAEDIVSFRNLMDRRPRLLPAPRPVRRADAPRQVPRDAGHRPPGEREPAQRVVLEVLDQGAPLRDARGQARRDQGQRVRGGDPDDERLERAGGVRA